MHEINFNALNQMLKILEYPNYSLRKTGCSFSVQVLGNLSPISTALERIVLNSRFENCIKRLYLSIESDLSDNVSP